MPNYTAQVLIERAQAAADMHDDFVTQTQWLRWATVENDALAVKVAQLGYVLNESFTDITITGADSYPIDEPLAVVGVYEITTNNLLRRVHSVNPFDGHRQTTNTIIGPARQFSFRRSTSSGNTTILMNMFPNPTSGTYRVYVIPHPAALTSVSGSVDYPLGWEERVVLGMARRALAKEESDTGPISEQIRQVDSDIEAAVWSRLLGDSPSVRNVDSVERGWISPYPYPWPPVSEWHFI